MADLILVFPGSSQAPPPTTTTQPRAAVQHPAANPPQSDGQKLPHPVAIPGPLSIPANPQPQLQNKSPPVLVYKIQVPAAPAAPAPAPTPAPTPAPAPAQLTPPTAGQQYQLVTTQPMPATQQPAQQPIQRDQPVYWWLGQPVPPELQITDQPKVEAHPDPQITSLGPPAYWWIQANPSN